MCAQLQGYTSNVEVDDGLEKAVKLLGKSKASIIGQAVEEKLDALGLLGNSEKRNFWDKVTELIQSGVPHEKINEALESLMEMEVMGE